MEKNKIILCKPIWWAFVIPQILLTFLLIWIIPSINTPLMLIASIILGLGILSPFLLCFSKKGRLTIIKAFTQYLVIIDEKIVRHFYKDEDKSIYRDEVSQIVIQKTSASGPHVYGSFFMKFIVIYRHTSYTDCAHEPYFTFVYTRRRKRLLEKWLGKEIKISPIYCIDPSL